MYILLTGRPPFGGNTDDEILIKIQRGKYDLSKYPWGIITKEAKDLITKLIEPSQKKRLSAEEALKHPWFNKKKTRALEKMINSIDKKSAKKLVENLKSYRTDNVMKTAVVAYLVHNNTQLEQAHEAVKLFNKIDTNNDGKIVKEELYNGLQAYLDIEGDLLKKEVDDIFARIDNDHNGYIEYEEFIRAAIDKEDLVKNEFLKYAFDYFDQDRSGAISLLEVKKLFLQSDANKRSEAAQLQLQMSFDQIDINNDGELTFEEFAQMMRKIMDS